MGVKGLYRCWRWRLSTLRHAVGRWSTRTLQVRNRLDLEMLECLPPVDRIVHFGLLHHLRNVDEHMKRCFAMSDDVVMETVVLDSTDPQRILFRSGRGDAAGASPQGAGSSLRHYYVERLAGENGFTVQRYFTADLNSGEYVH